MNYKIYLIISLVIVAAVSYLLFKQNTDQPPTTAYSDQSSNNSPATSMLDNNSNTQPLDNGTYQINPNSQINWQGSKTLIVGYKDNGTLNIKNGQFTIANNQITNSSFIFDMTSLKANSTGRGGGQSSLEKHLQSADFFDVKKYPESKFDLKSATTDSELNGTYQITGDLTIKGITKSINFPAVITNNAGQLKLMAEIKLDRTLWDIRYGSNKFFDNLANNVIDDIFTVTLNLTANKQ